MTFDAYQPPFASFFALISFESAEDSCIYCLLFYYLHFLFCFIALRKEPLGRKETVTWVSTKKLFLFLLLLHMSWLIVQLLGFYLFFHQDLVQKVNHLSYIRHWNRSLFFFARPVISQNERCWCRGVTEKETRADQKLFLSTESFLLLINALNWHPFCSID